jgi:hypothetical protein
MCEILLRVYKGLLQITRIIIMWKLGCALLVAVITMALAEHDFDEKVDLGSAAYFSILCKAGISTVAASVITGDIGVSPIAATAVTGFSLVYNAAHPSYSTSAQVVGKIYAADYGLPTPSQLGTAIGDMETAYTDASSRTISTASHLNRHVGVLSNQTFTSGVYRWESGISFDSNVRLHGGATDLFIFQTTGNMQASNGAAIVLIGGVRASNIVWQIAGFLQVGSNAHVQGTFLIKEKAVFQTGSSITGRILAQTAVTLDQVTVTGFNTRVLHKHYK